MDVASAGEPDGHASPPAAVPARGLTARAVRRPVTTVMAFGLLVVLGAVAYTKLPVRRLPSISYPYLRVSIADPGTNATTVAEVVTTPVEKVLGAQPGVVTMVGTSAPGRASVAVQLTQGTNVSQAAAAVALALGRLARTLPAGAGPPAIVQANPNALPMMNVALSGPLAPSQLYGLATTLVAPTLQEIPGVAQATVVGGRAPAVVVDVSSADLAAYGVSMDEIAAALRAENVSTSGGIVDVGPRSLVVRVHGGYGAAAQLAAVPIASRPGGAVLLGDVATVSQGIAAAQSAATLNGAPAVGLVVEGASGANSLAVDTAIRAALTRLGPRLPAGVTTTITGDITTYVRAALSDVELDLFLGVLIAALVLALFLHRLASTLIVMATIPVSLVATFLVLYLLHLSLDLISLMALSLLIGILVDDSIVVLENIHRHRALGASSPVAAIEGRREIGAAAIAITLTDVVVYLPIAFVSGNLGQLLREFGLTIVAATLFSLLVSFTLTPMLAARFARADAAPTAATGPRARRRLGDRFDAGFDRLANRYRGVVAWALRHRLVVMAVALACLVLSGAIVRLGVLTTTFVPREDNGVITVNASLPPGTPLSGDQAVLSGFARRLGHLPSVREVFVAAGYASGAGTGSNLGQVTLDLGPRDARPPIATYLARIRALARLDFPGLTARAHVQNPFVGGGARAASITVLGPSLPELDRIAASIAGSLRHSSAVSQVSTSVQPAIPQLTVAVDHAQAAYLGVSTSAIGTAVAAALGSTAVPPLVASSAAPVEPVTLVLDGGRALSPAELAAIPVRGAHGAVPLASVASLVATTGPAKITQVGGEDAVTVSASSPSGSSGPALAALLHAAATVRRPAGYSVNVGGEALLQQQAFGPLLGALELSLLLIYMLLAALYESFTDPLVVILAVPLATVGALGGLWAAGLPISIFALLAMIMLVGIVAKNAILLLDFARTLQRRGIERNEALARSGATRLRPILMTTATMVAAMVPLAFGTGIGSSERMPVGTVLISGLLSSTLLTLLVVPVLASLVDDARRGSYRLVASLRAKAAGRSTGRARGEAQPSVSLAEPGTLSETPMT